MNPRGMFALLKSSVDGFMEDDCTTQAAALSYCTIFSLPPLLLLLLMILGALVDPQDIRGQLQTQISALMGPTAAEQIRTILTQLHGPGSGSALATVLGIVGLLLGATGAFGQLQAALNRAWGVKPDPRQGGVRGFLLKRLFSFGMILSVAFLLLISLVVSTVLSAFGASLGRMLPDGVSTTLLQLLNVAFSLVVIAALFAAIFKVLPDAKVRWRDVWVGAFATAVLFVGGKFLIGFYIGRSNPGQAFGAAGSLAVLFAWVYYSAMIVLFGAEFTQSWVERNGGSIAPERGAVKVVDGGRANGQPGEWTDSRAEGPGRPTEASSAMTP
ncbi:MAG TPA: YihY/virulence factor BrkB family protein [Gemmatimonadales bacterium]|nr:YihY/virulence factor BrkB family protein [Gemmatimonadales bacterium]